VEVWGGMNKWWHDPAQKKPRLPHEMPSNVVHNPDEKSAVVMSTSVKKGKKKKKKAGKKKKRRKSNSDALPADSNAPMPIPPRVHAIQAATSSQHPHASAPGLPELAVVSELEGEVEWGDAPASHGGNDGTVEGHIPLPSDGTHLTPRSAMLTTTCVAGTWQGKTKEQQLLEVCV